MPRKKDPIPIVGLDTEGAPVPHDEALEAIRDKIAILNATSNLKH
jgi:hypothetical protein